MVNEGEDETPNQREIRRRRRQMVVAKGNADLVVVNINEKAADVDITEVTVRRLEKRLDEAYGEYIENLTELHCIDSTEPIDELSVKVNAARSLLDGMFERVAANKHRRESVDSESSDSAASVKSGTSVKANVHLPKIRIPEFSGDKNNWSQFSKLFEALVDKGEIDDVVKLQYLLGHLKGEALDLVSSYTVDDKSYKLVMEVLRERYENKRQLAHQYVTELMRMQACKYDAKLIQNLVDVSSRVYRQLGNLGYSGESLAQLLFTYLVLSKLNNRMIGEWEVEVLNASKKDETNVDKTCEVKIDDLWNFIKSKLTSLQAAETFAYGTNRDAVRKKTFIGSTSGICACCGKGHLIVDCAEFAKKSVDDRLSVVRRERLCYKCLKRGHSASECRSNNSYNKCNRNHNNLLHFSYSGDRDSRKSTEQSKSVSACVSVPETADESTKENNASVDEISPVPEMSLSVVGGTNLVLLATAQAYIADDDNRLHSVRVLLDPASQANIINKNVLQRLKLSTTKSHSEIMGLGGCSNNTQSEVHCRLFSRSRRAVTEFSAVVMDKITDKLPQVQIDTSSLHWNYIKQYELADKDFATPGEIDILLSASVVAQLLRSGGDVVHGPPGYPMLQKTRLGWVLFGDCNINSNIRKICNLSLENLVERFWTTEQLPTQICKTPETVLCEDHFEKTYSRDPYGRYIVKIPFRQRPTMALLGDTRSLAVKRFSNLERRGISGEYAGFMAEYESLGHMTRLNHDNQGQSKDCFYFPHHAVYKDDKIRVIFDGSASTKGHVSINELQYTGPIIQRSVFNILINFRLHQYVLKTDIVKMFRQVVVHPDDRCFQRIVWREMPNNELRDFELNTVTYGSTSGPYLAVRAVFQLLKDEGGEFPLAVEAIRESSFVDDVVLSAPSVANVIKIGNELIQLLQRGGFSLAKWASNSPEVESHFNVESNQLGASKVLGVELCKTGDVFTFCEISKISMPKRITKRTILGLLCSVYDPLGLLAPCVVVGKQLIQSLWRIQLNWDQELPTDLSAQMFRYFRSFGELRKLRVDRYMQIDETIEVSLIGFADASERAYAACVYVWSVVSSTKNVHVNLLVAKTRVAPLQTLSIPRLELCACLLLVELMLQVRQSLAVQSIVLYTDSQVVLAWLARPAADWSIFVANRISKIQSEFPFQFWRHCPSGLNAADIASRGVLADKLIHADMWWHGPMFLQDGVFLPSSQPDDVPVPEEVFNEIRLTKEVCVIAEPENEIISRYSTYKKLIKVTAWLLRFRANSAKLPWSNNSSYLTGDEMSRAVIPLARSVQRHAFLSDIYALQEGRSISTKSVLASLTPYLDADGLLRVGGRLRHSELSMGAKHPIIVPAKSKFAQLIIEQYHIVCLHGGPQMTLNAIRQKFWLVPSSRKFVQKITYKCTRCARFRRSNDNVQLMGDLPSARVTIGAVFSDVGIDYAGPIKTKGSRRSKRAEKSYIAVFICFKVRAVHLELVSSLSTDCFLAALRRFIARRGVPACIYSDHGSNFVGANAEIQLIRQFIRRRAPEIQRFLSENHVEWKMIPPGTPHMGGLWESAVKSMKHHLRRVVGNCVLTFEEATTLLSQIESCMNSRPLAPLNEGPDSLDVLTPSHFMVGRSVGRLPERYDAVNPNEIPITSRWQLVQRLMRQLWQRWQLEYLHNQQQRPKWRSKLQNLQRDDIVIIRDITPPMQWKLGRIVSQRIDGSGIARMYRIRTINGEVEKHQRFLIPIVNETE